MLQLINVFASFVCSVNKDWASEVVCSVFVTRSRVTWVTCWQYSILTFNVNYLPFKILHFGQIHPNWTCGCRDMNSSVKFKNKVKHIRIFHLYSPHLMYLKINIPNIWLIHLHHVTFRQVLCGSWLIDKAWRTSTQCRFALWFITSW